MVDKPIDYICFVNHLGSIFVVAQVCCKSIILRQQRFKFSFRKLHLQQDDQVEFKGKAKAFVRSYSFLAAILTYGHPAWEKLAIFLNFLIPKLPAPKEEDLSKGVLEAIDMDSYRVEAQASLKMALDDADAFIEPPPPGGGSGTAEIDKLSNIIKAFKDMFGNIEWKEGDKIRKVITEEIPARVAQDKAYQNAQANSDKQNAKLEHDKALNRVVLEPISDHTELFKQFSDNPASVGGFSVMKATMFELPGSGAAPEMDQT